MYTVQLSRSRILYTYIIHIPNMDEKVVVLALLFVIIISKNPWHCPGDIYSRRYILYSYYNMPVLNSYVLHETDIGCNILSHQGTKYNSYFCFIYGKLFLIVLLVLHFFINYNIIIDEIRYYS